MALNENDRFMLHFRGPNNEKLRKKIEEDAAAEDSGRRVFSTLQGPFTKSQLVKAIIFVRKDCEDKFGCSPSYCITKGDDGCNSIEWTPLDLDELREVHAPLNQAAVQPEEEGKMESVKPKFMVQVPNKDSKLFPILLGPFDPPGLINWITWFRAEYNGVPYQISKKDPGPVNDNEAWDPLSQAQLEAVHSLIPGTEEP